MIYIFSKTILPDKLILEIKAAGLPFSSLTAFGTALEITTSAGLSEAELALLTTIVADHSATPTTAHTVGLYLDSIIFPFITNLIRVFAAENIAMGITQYGKTGALLGLFTKKYDVNSNGLPICLKDTFDTGSLYEAIKVIQHLRNNPTEFDGLSPFITDARLHAMKNNIEAALGVTLT